MIESTNKMTPALQLHHQEPQGILAHNVVFPSLQQQSHQSRQPFPSSKSGLAKDLLNFIGSFFQSLHMGLVENLFPSFLQLLLAFTGSTNSRAYAGSCYYKTNKMDRYLKIIENYKKHTPMFLDLGFSGLKGLGGLEQGAPNQEKPSKQEVFACIMLVVSVF